MSSTLPGSKPQRLLCSIPFPEPKATTARIRKKFPNIDLVFQESKLTVDWDKNNGLEPGKDEWKDVTILCTASTFPDPPSIAPNLEYIHVISAGTNHMSNAAVYTDTQIPITTSSGIHGATITEWVILTSLAASRKYDTLREWQKRHAWDDSEGGKALFQTVSDNVGKRLGVLGYGAIGRQVARVASALGMDVIAFTASPRPTAESKKDTRFIIPGTGDEHGEIPSAWYSGTDKASLHHFLSQDIDHLLVSLPLLKDTARLLGKDEFEILSKRNAFVTNIARGEIIVQADLIEALTAYENDSTAVPGQGRKGLRGAALDVMAPEPLPKDDPLWDAPNCIITPHVSGISESYADRALQVLEINLERRASGQSLMNLVKR